MTPRNFPRGTNPRTNPKNRFPVSLNTRLDRKLFAYAAAAGAAGVSLAALAQPCQAEIVYTPAHTPIPRRGSLAIDLNHDGITDFTIRSSVSSGCNGPGCVLQNLIVSPNAPNRVWVTYGGRSYARALSAGNKVGPDDNFASQFIQLDRCKATNSGYYLSGSWPNVRNRFLGLQLTINGKTHYGWARLTVSVQGGRFCTAGSILTGYAYETDPGRAILTGHKSKAQDVKPTQHSKTTLGMLALGSIELVAWRRDDPVNAERDGVSPRAKA